MNERQNDQQKSKSPIYTLLFPKTNISFYIPHVKSIERREVQGYPINHPYGLSKTKLFLFYCLANKTHATSDTIIDPTNPKLLAPFVLSTSNPVTLPIPYKV
mmetsp:Transcript_21335/g.39184  ORF Transcript_21335/g.39184 Transcript_21335/m.39184 type:complete len:102 (-) Transcript_21335:679-984(-)